MYIDEKILKKLIKDYNIGCEAIDLVETLKGIDKIRKNVQSLNDSKESAKKEYEDRIRILNIQLKEVRDTCSHYDIESTRCPASGRTEYETCTICGKELL